VIRAVLGKDLASLWVSPLPFVVGATFQAVIGVLMVNQLEVRGQAVVQPLFPLAGFLLLLVVPVLTMRSFADEARSGDLDLLLAVPVPAPRLVVAKWLAAWLTALVVLAPAALFAVLVGLWGSPDAGPAITGFVGLALLAATASAVGVLTSACTDSQPIAAMTALFAGVVAWFAHVGGEAAGDTGLLRAVSLSERLRLFAGGAIDSGDTAFFLAATIAALVVAATVLDARRLR
jgi:ABC-2 type transport system permease protein